LAVLVEPVGVDQSGLSRMACRKASSCVTGDSLSGVLNLVGQELDRHGPPEQLDQHPNHFPVARYVGDEPVSLRSACVQSQEVDAAAAVSGDDVAAVL
jgi:hypothetical protein